MGFGWRLKSRLQVGMLRMPDRSSACADEGWPPLWLRQRLVHV